MPAPGPPRLDRLPPRGAAHRAAADGGTFAWDPVDESCDGVRGSPAAGPDFRQEAFLMFPACSPLYIALIARSYLAAMAARMFLRVGVISPPI